MAKVAYWLNLSKFIRKNETTDFKNLPNYLLSNFKDDPVNLGRIKKILEGNKIRINVCRYNSDLAVLDIDNTGHTQTINQTNIKSYSEIAESIETKPEDKGYLPYEYAFLVWLESDVELE